MEGDGIGKEHVYTEKLTHSMSNGGTKKIQGDEQKDSNFSQKNGRTKLLEKQFKLRNSLLTDLIDKNPHIRTIYHISIAIFIYCFVNTLAYEYFRQEKITLGTSLIISEFGQIYNVFIFWLVYTILPVIIFFIFKMWASVRINISPSKSIYLRTWDATGILVYIIYIISSFISASSIVSTYLLTVSSAFLICLEQVRYLLKLHSFLRYNCEKVIKYKTHSDQHLDLPTLSKFLYFLFAPTLLYRDEYPRTNIIRVKFVTSRILELVLTIISLNLIMQKIVIPSFLEFEKTNQSWGEVILLVLYNCGPGILMQLIGFFIILHVVQNLFAELLRFGDRLFYEDWWTCTGFLSFFRSWNILVGDWLYTYIYKDVYQLLIPNKTVAKMSVFVISAIVHEWVLWCVFGSFFPILFFEMIFSGLLALLKSPKNNFLNILMWCALILGNGINVSLYGLEYMGRPASSMKSKNTFE